MTEMGNEPVHLIEDEETGGRFLVYGTEKGLRLDIRFEGETLWMTQAQIAQLFGVDRTVITKHIANVYVEGELDPDATSAKIALVRQEGGRTVERKIDHYNLDAIISVGYRVSSAQATIFRRWATGILVQYAKKGFVVDAPRLKQPENFDRIAELREVIRDLRSDEANLYREIRSICAMCQDYDGGSEAWREFYQQVQAKIVFAVTSHTPSEIIATRSNPTAPNMGLQTWPNDNIRKQDVTVSKNYLAQAEIRELNRLTDILLSIFEDQLDLGRLVVMADAMALLDRQLKELGRTVLKGGGSMKTADAKRIAEARYEQFDAKRKAEKRRLADIQLAELAKEGKALPKRPKKQK